MAGGIVSTLTGLYPDRNGINVSNSYQYLTGSPTSTGFNSAFTYWTDPVGTQDPRPNLTTTGGANAPAPWVAFTRAGCDVGAVSTANIELENTSTGASGDITSVYGNGVRGESSPQASIAIHEGAESTADFQGISVHCPQAHSDANGGNAFGPGQAGYVAQPRSENQAFTAFFDRLNKDGITKRNTLFVFTVDEGDHFAGGPPTNPGCDRVTVPCQYTPGGTGPNTVGEQDVDLVNALKRETGNSTEFDIHADSVPTFYVHGSSDPSGPPATDPKVRRLERDLSGLTLTNVRTRAVDTATQHIADRTDQTILHMTNADPQRTPSFTLFGNPTYYYEQEGSSGYTCANPTGPPGCPVAYNGGRLEPRRRQPGHRADLARAGRDDRPAAGPNLEPLDRPHRCSPDDALRAQPAPRLRPGRPARARR